MSSHSEETYGQRSLRQMMERSSEAFRRQEWLALIARHDALPEPSPQGRARGGLTKGLNTDARIALALVQKMGGFAAAFELAGYEDSDPDANAEHFWKDCEELPGIDAPATPETIARRLRNTSAK